MTPQWINYIDQVDRHTVVGHLKLYRQLWSPQLQNRRDILVYLPPSYSNTKRQYPVIYMHDGQNLFDAYTSFVGEWQVDETLEALSQEGLEAIVVGLPHMETARLDEYSPFYDSICQQGGQGDQYLAFIVETVKPLIDRTFRTLPAGRYTGLCGSSMGGLISLYGFFRHAGLFGFVGAMSPAFWFAQDDLFTYLEAAPFQPGKIYLDTGTAEMVNVAGYGEMAVPPTVVIDMYQLLQRKGYLPGETVWYVEDEGAVHNEAAWANRLPSALRWLVPKTIP